MAASANPNPDPDPNPNPDPDPDPDPNPNPNPNPSPNPDPNPNPDPTQVAASAADEHATRLNAIRQVLSKFTRMRGLGLPQPHEKRTGLCDLEPHKLSAEYRAGMPRVQHTLTLILTLP